MNNPIEITRPIRYAFNLAVFDGVVMEVINRPLPILVIMDGVLTVAPLPEQIFVANMMR
jgi:hypothetical protein